MKKILILSCVLMGIACARPMNAQMRPVDMFVVGQDSVQVFFYDPLSILMSRYFDFYSRTDREKSALLDSFEHNNPLYLFKVLNPRGDMRTWLCIRGIPSKKKTDRFYKLEVVKLGSAYNFNPMDTGYADKVVQVFENVNCAGTMFEHMDFFEDIESKKHIGKRMHLWGYVRRVQPYFEIKASVIGIMRKLK